MEWAQFALLLISIGGMFAWLRSDIAVNRTEASADRRDLLQIIRTVQSESRDLMDAIRQDIKDFHGRLCSIETRYHQQDLKEVKEPKEIKEKKEKKEK